MGLYYALGQSGRTLYIALVFFLAIIILVKEFEIDSTSVFEGTYLLFFAYMSLGAQTANIPSVRTAQQAAIPVFSVIDEPSTLDVRHPEGRTLTKIEKGKIEFIDVTFNYPTRANNVMDKFNINIPAGAKIALVGHSGCGKSTLVNILLRFYTVNSGQILIDG